MHNSAIAEWYLASLAPTTPRWHVTGAGPFHTPRPSSHQLRLHGLQGLTRRAGSGIAQLRDEGAEYGQGVPTFPPEEVNGRLIVTHQAFEHVFILGGFAKK